MGTARKYRIRAVIAIVLFIFFLSAGLSTAFFNCVYPLEYLPAFMVGKDVNEEGVLRVTYLDVGYGDCALIELPDGKTAVIDCGEDVYYNTSGLLKLLNERRIDVIDYLICTSVSDEHCGGVRSILRFKQIKHAFIPYSRNWNITGGYRTLMEAVSSFGITVEYAAALRGVFGEEHEYFLTFLSPTEVEDSTGAYAEMNADPTPTNKDNASAVVWLEYGGVGFAFLSDARKGALGKILEAYNLSCSLEVPFLQHGQYSVKLENCKFVTVAGHGSEDNICPEWYAALTPEVGVVSVGGNYRKCPSQVALADVQKYAILHNTGESGNLTVTVSGGTYAIK